LKVCASSVVRADVAPALLRYAPAVLSTLAHPLVHGGVVALLTLVAVGVAAVRAVGSWLRPRSRDTWSVRAGGRGPAWHGAVHGKAHKWWSPLNLLDAKAHSSMWEDLQRGRVTEV